MPGRTGKRAKPARPCGGCRKAIHGKFFREPKVDYCETCWWEKLKVKTKPVPELFAMTMPEWKDGQPGCMTCLCELKIRSMVYQDKKTFVIYCEACGEKSKK